MHLWLISVAAEIIGNIWAIKKRIPLTFRRRYEPRLPQLYDLDVFYRFRQSNRLWQANRLTFVVHKYRGSSHLPLSMYISLGYTNYPEMNGICQLYIPLATAYPSIQTLFHWW